MTFADISCMAKEQVNPTSASSRARACARFAQRWGTCHIPEWLDVMAHFFGEAAGITACAARAGPPASGEFRRLEEIR